jgi:plasmid stability protein
MNISIQNLSPDTLNRLRQRAKRNHRSLQGELMALIDQAVESEPRKLSVDEISAKVSRLGIKRRNEAVKLIRSDRDR